MNNEKRGTAFYKKNHEIILNDLNGRHFLLFKKAARNKVYEKNEQTPQCFNDDDNLNPIMDR